MMGYVFHGHVFLVKVSNYIFVSFSITKNMDDFVGHKFYAVSVAYKFYKLSRAARKPVFGVSDLV